MHFVLFSERMSESVLILMDLFYVKSTWLSMTKLNLNSHQACAVVPFDAKKEQIEAVPADLLWNGFSLYMRQFVAWVCCGEHFLMRL